MKKEENIIHPKGCPDQLRAIKDTMELLSGKWKLQIIGHLILSGTMRFMELKRALDGVAPKKLSHDLQELEINQLITRTVMETKPITVEYAITEHGRTLDKLINEITDWGLTHRKEIMK
ncbi:MAG: helix-turn-helix transcriptional regulator [Aureispira sp.]|nr:helix-turn-helix transcriptional regulator [Aureispira sp.]